MLIFFYEVSSDFVKQRKTKKKKTKKNKKAISKSILKGKQVLYFN